ncbi:MAG TPA: hypothetical protein VG325_18785 [Solirubrobacteraceae bacterium]|jgi:hypothetical protein|nr:hypothetical protein [Solirubrobacteraceae bacterium]
MPEIIVTADKPNDEGQPPVMFRERVSVSDFESAHFANQLVERLGWAVGDADELNRRSSLQAEHRRARRRMVDAAQRELALSGRPVRPVS